MQITSEMVKNLREKTGCGMMDCKAALNESSGDFDKAVETLRKKGLASAAQKSGRKTAEGIIESYVHLGGKIGVLVEVNCETDFVARNIEFHSLVRDIAMQVAASNPQYVNKEDVPEPVLNQEREILRSQALTEGKPALPAGRQEKIVDKIVEGRLEKFFSEVCLLEQPFIKDPDKPVNVLVAEHVAKFGENIKIRRFVRFQLGEN